MEKQVPPVHVRLSREVLGDLQDYAARASLPVATVARLFIERGLSPAAGGAGLVTLGDPTSGGSRGLIGPLATPVLGVPNIATSIDRSEVTPNFKNPGKAR